MQRRRVLQIGAALAALPLTGCGAPAPEPQVAIAASGDPPGRDAPTLAGAMKAPDPAPASNAPDDKSASSGKEPSTPTIKEAPVFTSRAEDGHDHLAVIYNRPPKA